MKVDASRGSEGGGGGGVGLAAVEMVGVAAAGGVLVGGVETATIWAGGTERRSRWLANQNAAPAAHRTQRQSTSTLRLRCTVGPPKRQLRMFAGGAT